MRPHEFDFLRPHGLLDCTVPTPLSFAIFWSLLNFMSIELVMLSNHLILCCPLLLLSLTFPSIKVFSKESTHCVRWSKCCCRCQSVISPRVACFALCSARKCVCCCLCDTGKGQCQTQSMSLSIETFPLFISLY